MKVRVLIVDDEPLARLGIVSRLASHRDIVIVGECETAESATEAIHAKLPDLLFLDIRLGLQSGLDVLKSIDIEQRPIVVLLTAFREHALEAFDLQVFDYLLKPIDDDRFADCMKRVQRYVSLRYQAEGSEFEVQEQSLEPKYRDRFVLRDKQRVLFINVSDIDWIEGLGDYAGLHVAGKTHMLRRSLTNLQSQLDPASFCRIHRSTIIRVDRLVRIAALPNRESVVTLRDGAHLRVSRTYSESLRSIFRDF